ncbi:hypothetical protein HDU97_007396 [Phlyctochytrium planicorne]|nr:hypothetical protein HDU97_007396 [Phlyctochytrium planicorne]
MFWQKQPESAKKKDNYKVIKKLGEGTYGVVKEVTHIPTKRNYALKAIKKKPLANNPQALKVVQREMTLLKGLPPHRNIISLFETFETNDKFYLAFELATGGELFERISQKGRFTERDAAEIVFEVLDGISYLHAHNIVHSLYKTSEPNSDIVIADFGVANIDQGEDMLRTLCGSPAYAAPEVIKRSGHGRPADIWSIGVIAFTLLMGYGPWYYCEDVPSMFEAITHGRWKFESPYVDNVSMEARSFIKKLMQLDPKKRPTARQAMIDTWLVKYSRRANEYARKARDAQKAQQAAQQALPAPISGAAAVAAAAADIPVVSGLTLIPGRVSSKVAIVEAPLSQTASSFASSSNNSSAAPSNPAPVPKKSETAATVSTIGTALVEPPKAAPDSNTNTDASFDTASVVSSESVEASPTNIVIFDERVKFELQQDPESPFVNNQGQLFEDLKDLNFTDLHNVIEKPVVDDDQLPNLAESVPGIDPKRKFKRAVKIIGTLKLMEKMEKMKLAAKSDGNDPNSSDDEFVLANQT